MGSYFVWKFGCGELSHDAKIFGDTIRVIVGVYPAFDRSPSRPRGSGVAVAMLFSGFRWPGVIMRLSSSS
jgi:hypothetical protein